MMTVDKTASQPIYRQVIQALRERLERGELLPGGRAPSERELADLYDISRMTARGALRELIRDGLLYTVPGKGTFVAWPKMQQPLNTLTSFTEDMRARGLLAGTRVLGQGIEVSSSAVTERLRLSA
nr:GntR family transcriptional regulator [Chloroflexota bacterium]